MKSVKFIAVSMLCSGALSAHALSFFDDFNRADSGDLGSNWTNQNLTIGISGNMAMAPSQNLNLATVNGYSDSIDNTVICFDVFSTGSGTEYAAAVLGWGGGTNMFVKVQNNGGANGFTNFGFYTGNNSSVSFQPLTQTFMSARVWVYASGNVGFLDIDTDFNGTIDQNYSFDYGVQSWGTGAGLGAYGTAKIDNFGINAVPEPATMTMLGLGAVALMRRRKKA